MTIREIEKVILDGKELDDEQKEFLLKRSDIYWDNHPDVVNRFPRWRKYIAWIAGYQLFDYNKISKKLIEVPITRQHKLVFNRLRPFVRTMLAKLAADVPSMSVLPNTTDNDDVDAARVASSVVAGIADKIHFVGTVNDLKLWTIICNRAYLRVIWNEEESSVIGYEKEETVSPNPEEEGKADGFMKSIPVEGDVLVECVPPFNVRTDPLYYNKDRWRWAIYGEEVDAEEVEHEYKLEKGSLTATKDTTFDQAYAMDMQDESDLVIGSPDKREDVTGRTVVKKYFYTKNIIAIIAGTKVLEVKKNVDNEIPIYEVEDRIVPIDTYQREFQYNESVIKDMIPVQREYNRMKSIISIALDRASKLKVMTPLGSILSKRQWVNDYGVFIDFNPRAGNPYQLKLDPFPAEVTQFSADLENEMEKIMNLSPVSSGRLPERASHASGTLVNILLEQDDVVVNPLLNRINDAISAAWSYALRLIQRNYVETRYIRYTGQDGTYQIAKFRGSDLRGNTDVKVVSQTGLPRSRALRIEYIMKLREVGLLKDDKTTLEMLEFGNAERVFKESFLHERRARRENDRILTDQAAQAMTVAGWVYPLEDHMSHLTIHLQLRLGPEWDKLNPGQQQALEKHIQDTYMTIQGLQMQAQAGQATNEQAGGAAEAGTQPPETGTPA